MQKLRTIIADDEPDKLALIQYMAQSYCADMLDIIATSQTLTETYKLVKTHKPDLLLIDVEFGSETCFDLIIQLKKEELISQLVFISGHDDTKYFNNAFKFSALQYITKPIDHQLFTDTITEAYEKHKTGEKTVAQQVDVMIANNNADPNQLFLKQVRKKYRNVNMEDIVYLATDEGMTAVHMMNGETIKTTKQLKFYEFLTLQNGFFRIHQSHIINQNQIKEYHSETLKVSMKNTKILDVARSRDKELRRRLGLL